MHEAIAEALLCGNTEVKLDNLPGYVEGLYSVIPDDESETTNVELQFKVRTYACLCDNPATAHADSAPCPGAQ